jgi:tetratricopeptide (TPR) repeat protein
MGPSPKLQVMLGEAYRKENKLDLALAAFKDAVSDPKAKNPDARLEMARIYKLRHESAKAEEAANRAAQEFLGRPDKVAESYALLGQLAEARGDRKKADDYYQKSLNASSDYAEGYYFYARFLDGDRKSRRKAHTLAQEYLRRDPHGAYAADAARM